MGKYGPEKTPYLDTFHALTFFVFGAYSYGNIQLVIYIIVSEALLLTLCSMDFLYFTFPRIAKSNAQKQRQYREKKNLNDEKYLEKERQRQKKYYIPVHR